MNTDILTKENILEKIDLQDAFNYYLQPYHNKGILRQGVHIYNPFLERKQKTPSFNIYKSKNGDWRYKDFATGDEGSIFDLIMKLKQCTFREALSILNEDFSLKLVEENSGHSFTIEPQKEWDAYTLEY